MQGPLTLKIRRSTACRPSLLGVGATPWSTPCVDGDDTWVMGLNADGNVYSGYCTNAYGSHRFPHPQYAVEVDGGLDQYTTNELIAEINRRMNG
ncbi:MAG: hypothetical protein ACLSF6_03470 [Evtepia gabavorous]